MHWREIRNENVIWVIIGIAFIGLCAYIAIEVSSRETLEFPSALNRTILSREEQIAIMKVCITDAKTVHRPGRQYYQNSKLEVIALGFFLYRTNPAHIVKGETNEF